MKKAVLLVAALITVGVFNTQAQELNLPQTSPWAQVSQKFGMAQATITYSRPSIKGRKIFGALVPYGQVWRTGANECTKLAIEGNNVMINNMSIAAGTYSLFTIPGENEWTIIINKNTDLWGASGYKQEEDLMRFTVKPNSVATTESFTIDFANVKDKNATVQIYWENTKVSFELTSNYIDEGMKQIQDAIAASENTANLYNDAAEFYLDNNLDPKLALEWAKKSTAQKERYWNLHTLARAYAANGLKAEALDTATKALDLAVKANNTGESDTISRQIEEWKKM